MNVPTQKDKNNHGKRPDNITDRSPEHTEQSVCSAEGSRES